MKRYEILDTAKACVCGDREQDYGSPEDNFATIAQLWEPYLKRKCVSFNADVCVNPEDVAVLLSLVKIGRIASGHGKADNWIDLAGYAACGGEIESKSVPPNTTSDKPEPWGKDDRVRRCNLICKTVSCRECSIYLKVCTSDARTCDAWCVAHPAEARAIMDEWEAEHGVD